MDWLAPHKLEDPHLVNQGLGGRGRRYPCLDEGKPAASGNVFT